MPQSTRKPLTPAKRAQLRRLPKSGSSTQAHPFSAERHGLSPEQVRLAQQLLRRAERQRPLSGEARLLPFRYALRCAGIVSAVKRGVVGNSRFGRRLQGHHGGNVMRDHGLHILRAQAPRGYQAMLSSRERKAAAVHYESTGEILPIGAPPPQTKEEARVRHLITQWEQSIWQTQQAERLKW